jgi:hypothetical protein
VKESLRKEVQKAKKTSNKSKSMFKKRKESACIPSPSYNNNPSLPQIDFSWHTISND